MLIKVLCFELPPEMCLGGGGGATGLLNKGGGATGFLWNFHRYRLVQYSLPYSQPNDGSKLSHVHAWTDRVCHDGVWKQF